MYTGSDILVVINVTAFPFFLYPCWFKNLTKNQICYYLLNRQNPLCIILIKTNKFFYKRNTFHYFNIINLFTWYKWWKDKLVLLLPYFRHQDYSYWTRTQPVQHITVSVLTLNCGMVDWAMDISFTRRPVQQSRSLPWSFTLRV